MSFKFLDYISPLMLQAATFLSNVHETFGEFLYRNMFRNLVFFLAGNTLYANFQISSQGVNVFALINWF